MESSRVIGGKGRLGELIAVSATGPPDPGHGIWACQGSQSDQESKERRDQSPLENG